MFDIAFEIVDPVLAEIRQHSTDSIERALCQLLHLEYGLAPFTYEITHQPLANQIWGNIDDKMRSHGILSLFLASLRTHKHIIQLTSDDLGIIPSKEDVECLRVRLISHIRRVRPVQKLHRQYLKYVIVATGNIYEDAKQARLAVRQGADCIAVIRTTAQSLLDFVPEGLSTEGFGGTYATFANFQYMRKELNEEGEKAGRHIYLVNYASGLCMPEITVFAILADLDMLLNDALYGILFRDINPLRTLIDQNFSRQLCALSDMIINTGEDNYLTTSDAIEKAWSVTASQCINYAFAKRAGLEDYQLGIGHAFEIDPCQDNALSYEFAHAMLTRELFPESPIKYMPPTRFKSGDIFFSHCLDAMYNFTATTSRQSIHLLGMNTEAIHTPFIFDRLSSLNSANYINKIAHNFMDNFAIRDDSFIRKRMEEVKSQARSKLSYIRDVGLYEAIGEGLFADISRDKYSGKGAGGVFKKSDKYIELV